MTKKIKLAFCLPDMIVGGVESVFILTLEELLKHPEYKITVFMQSKLQEAFYQEWFDKHPQIQLVTVYPLLVWFERKKTNIFPLENIRKIIFSLYKKYRRMKFSFGDSDVFIDYKNSSFFKELKHVRKPKITWCHGSFDFFVQDKQIERLKYYDKLVVLTDDFKSELLSMYPEVSGKVVRIYNPINVDDVIKKSNVAPSMLGRYFCVVARLGSPKDLRTVIYAFDDFWKREGDSDVKLVLVGEGPKRKNLMELADKLVSKNNIVFAGVQTNPFGYMRNAMAHIFSSKSEGFGMVLMEAAALKTLNISSNHKSGAAEILQNGKCGLLFEVGDIISLSHIMSDVYHEKVSIAQITENAFNSLDRFAADKIIGQITNLVAEVLSDDRK